eukprot:jgi/Picre1/30518/NNA_005881.t1
MAPRLKSAINVLSLASKISQGNRWALSKGLTLAESQNREQQQLFVKLIGELAGKQTILENGCFRIGVSGPPGAGKNPSSLASGGSILGDKTRMSKLSSNKNAYIRPSASGKTLGGVNRAMHNSILLCSAAGFDRVIIETVGVGQSELSVMNMVDCMVLILPPVGGDELQMIKRGITEFADIIAVNKADGSTKTAALRMASSVSSTLHLLSRSRSVEWSPRVLVCSGRTSDGVEELEQTLDEYLAAISKQDGIHNERVRHLSNLLLETADGNLIDSFHSDPMVQNQIKNTYLPRLLSGTQSVSEAAIELIEAYKKHSN